MSEASKVLSVAGYNFGRWKKNPRIILTFVLAFVLCLMLSGKVVSFAYNYHTVLQIAEVFIWTFGDANSIMMSSLLLLLLFADMPFVTTGTPYILYRMKRSTWVWGQIVYIIIATFLYVLFLLIITCLLCAPKSFVGNQWSDTAALLGYSGAGGQIAIPASVKAMEGSLPYQCSIKIFLLLLLYELLTVTLMMLFKLAKKEYFGVLAVFGLNLYGLLLNPQIFNTLLNLPSALEYKANLLVGWLSPLNHATYYMHNFGYDYLPQIWISGVIFLVLSALNVRGIYRKIKKYEFDFLQREE